jgi:hypothetical protein
MMPKNNSQSQELASRACEGKPMRDVAEASLQTFARIRD